MAEKQYSWVGDFVKTCGIQTGLLVFLAGGCYVLFSLRPPFPTFAWTVEGPGVAGPVAGFCLWFSLLYVRWARQNEEDRALLNRRFLRHGERAFVGGTVRSVGPLLSAPFSGRECVGYYYVATHTTSTGKSGPTTWTDYEGYALSPFVVRSRLGDVRPLPEASKEFFERLPGSLPDGAAVRGAEYLKNADFGEKKTSVLGGVSHERAAINGPGDFRYDLSIGDPPRDPFQCSLEERIIPPDEKIYLIGAYSAEQEGLLPDPDILNRPFRVELGDETKLAKNTRSRYSCAVAWALLGVAVGVVYFLAFRPIYG